MNKQLEFNLSDGRTRPPKYQYKGQNGRLYDNEPDALETYGYRNGKARWVLTSAFFDPPHYVFVEFTT